MVDGNGDKHVVDRPEPPVDDNANSTGMMERQNSADTTSARRVRFGQHTSGDARRLTHAAVGPTVTMRGSTQTGHHHETEEDALDAPPGTLHFVPPIPEGNLASSLQRLNHPGPLHLPERMERLGGSNRDQSANVVHASPDQYAHRPAESSSDATRTTEDARDPEKEKEAGQPQGNGAL